MKFIIRIGQFSAWCFYRIIMSIVWDAPPSQKLFGVPWAVTMFWHKETHCFLILSTKRYYAKGKFLCHSNGCCTCAYIKLSFCSRNFLLLLLPRLIKIDGDAPSNLPPKKSIIFFFLSAHKFSFLFSTQIYIVYWHVSSSLYNKRAPIHHFLL